MQSRYYSPEWGRFINADAIAGSIGELLGHNIFAYCKNNPVNMHDDAGFRAMRVDADVSGGDKFLCAVNEFLGTPVGQAVTTAVDTAISGGVSGALSKSISNSWNSSGWYMESPSGLTLNVGKFTNVSKSLNIASKAGAIGLGVGALISTGVSIWDNYAHYTQRDAKARTSVDIGAAVIIGGPVGLTGAAAVGAGFIAGMAISAGANFIKDTFFGTKRI